MKCFIIEEEKSQVVLTGEGQNALYILRSQTGKAGVLTASTHASLYRLRINS